MQTEDAIKKELKKLENRKGKCVFDRHEGIHEGWVDALRWVLK